MFGRIRLALLSLCLVTGTAGAQTGVGDGLFYWGVSGSVLRGSIDGPQLLVDMGLDDWELVGGAVKLGIEPHPRFALELRAGTTGGDTVTATDAAGDTGRLRLETEYFGAALARLNVTTGRARLYLLGGVGYAKLMATLDINGARFSRVTEDESAPAWGAGIELYGNHNVAINAEWLRLLHDRNNDVIDYYVDAWTLGVTYHY